MTEDETTEHLFAALRQCTGRPIEGAVAAVLEKLEARARDRLRDVPPPIWDKGALLAYECAGAKPPRAAWDFDRAEGPHGVAHLLSTLTPGRESWALRWYPAAAVLRQCLAIRQNGCASAQQVAGLHALVLQMPAYETALGRDARARSAKANAAHIRARAAKSDPIIDAMAARVSLGKTVSQAARETYKRDGLGASEDANRRLWYPRT